MSSFYLKRRIKSFLRLSVLLVICVTFLYYTNSVLYPLAYTYSKVICESYVNENVRSILKESAIQVSYQNGSYNVEDIQAQLIEATSLLEERLGSNDKVLISKIPIGAFTGIHLLENTGFKVPLRIRILQSVSSQIVSDVKEYGLNNALVEICLVVNVKYMMFLPLSDEEMRVEVKYPLAITIFEGNAVTLNIKQD